MDKTMSRRFVSELEKLENLSSRSLRLKMIWMWIDQKKLSFKEFCFLLDSIGAWE